jgi:excisionase family DNA binding protein
MTVFEVAFTVGKTTGYVRQHIHRGHLEASRDGRGRVVIEFEEVRRWAKSRDLEFVKREEVEMSGVAHAIIMPFPVANLVTWCGHRCDSRAVKNDFLADSPGAVTCQKCIHAMKESLENLKTWVPKLAAEKPPSSVDPPK